MGRRRPACLVLALALVLTSCTYADREPGLFGRADVSRPSTPDPAPSIRGPALPVVAETVWTAGSGVDLRVRIAVHAVRRITGGTVLDYSLTPLADDTSPPDSALPRTTDLGLLGSEAGEPQILLLEQGGRGVYRPLTRGRWRTAQCLCAPVSLVQRELRLGRTSLLQVTFPALPAELRTVDVDVATVPPFFNVPVIPAGMVPLAAAPVDLARPLPAQSSAPADRRRVTPVFRGADGQQFEIRVESVHAGRTFTALDWTIRSVTAGPGVSRRLDPPFREAGVAELGNGASAGAPTAVPSGRRTPVLRSRLVAAEDRRRCLCTNLSRPLGSLAEADRRVSAVTVLPPLPRGTVAVDVTFPGAGTVTGVRTTAPSDGAFRTAGPVPTTVRTWSEGFAPALGWAAADWPTPVPPPDAVAQFPTVVSALVR